MENCSLLVDNCTDLFSDFDASNITRSTADVYSDGDNSTYESIACEEWVPAQHNLIQLSNFCFAAAFCIPRSYQHGIIILRALVTVGFFVQAIWSGVHVCSFDIVTWSSVLGVLNLLHTLALCIRMIPPSLSPELTELYGRVFSPLKVSRKHFKELTREASILTLDPGDSYAIEDETNADERLSILLKGKGCQFRRGLGPHVRTNLKTIVNRLKVTCDSIHLHYITSYQFIDSPEWEAGHVTSDELFQVSITAEEESMYLCWPKLKLARVLRHRPNLKIILSNLIGKDITQKLYWLNEAVGLSGALGGKDNTPTGCDHFRRVMSRSLSADAVNTSTKGHVKSQSWRQQAGDKTDSLIFSDNESSLLNLTQHEWWQPVRANQFLENSPFPAATIVTSNTLLPATPSTPTKPRKPREVKFDESQV